MMRLSRLVAFVVGVVCGCIVPLGSEGSGVGSHLAVNGVVLETSEEVFARLAVAPTIVTLSLARGDDRPVDVTLSGLPDDEDEYLYLAATRTGG
jgi:hypothetical protein